MNGISFARRGGRLLSCPGRGKRDWMAEMECERIQRGYRLSARDLFDLQRVRLLASRPLLEESTDEHGRVTQVFGKPTFRNVIEDGELR